MTIVRRFARANTATEPEINGLSKAAPMLRPYLSQVSPRALLHRLVDDTRGGVLVLSVVLLLFVLGTGGLILDFGRVWNAQSELQAFADHAALVAAGELDGNADAITRANNALAQLITDRQAYASQDVTLDATDLQTTFLRGLPAADTDDDFGPFITTDPAIAQFVRVVVNPHTVSTIFANVLVAVSGNEEFDFNVAAGAVAGFTRWVCDIPPLMICNPWEGLGGSFASHAAENVGIQMRAKMKDGATNYGPGIMGLLQPPTLDTDDEIRRVMGRINPDTPCYAGTVDVHPGSVTGPVMQGLNARFDIYDSPIREVWRFDPQYAPAPNVTKGAVPTTGGPPSGPFCKSFKDNEWAQAPDTVPLPRDACFETGSNCQLGNPRIGSGDWDRVAYWAANHGGASLPMGLGADATRYDVYRYEIEQNLIPESPLEWPDGEDGHPRCTATGPTPDPDRRVLLVAVVNCQANYEELRDRTDIPVHSFARMFLTEPAGNTYWGATPDDIFLELIEVVGVNEGLVHEFPQLHR